MYPPRRMLIWCIFWVLFISVAYSDAGASMGLFLLCYGITLVWGLSWMIRLIFHAWRSWRGLSTERRGIAYWTIEPVAFILAIVIASSGVPTYLRFMASRPAFARYAQSVNLPGGDSKSWVGLYAVRETEVLSGGVVRFITSESLLDDAGFAFSPNSAPPIVGEDSYTKLPFAEGWYHWNRSW